MLEAYYIHATTTGLVLKWSSGVTIYHFSGVCTTTATLLLVDWVMFGLQRTAADVLINQHYGGSYWASAVTPPPPAPLAPLAWSGGEGQQLICFFQDNDRVHGCILTFSSAQDGQMLG